ncbi:MAG: dienelactone hydrolase family protein [Alphaproteobacteria bacterium]|nr:dienelactone hydrolase family protein [Alphaproteobacteria bacterium]
MDALTDFDRRDFTAEVPGVGAVTRAVYAAGSGPGVLVVHEVPGITPPVADFGRRVRDAGFTVWMPSLFGTPGRDFSGSYSVGQIGRACIAREFAVLADHRSSPITAWLRAAARALHQAAGGPGVGAVGMCLTGNFALALMVDPWVRAPVLSQPSLPFWPRDGLHLSDADLDTVKAGDTPLLGLRFTHDVMCPGARFARLRRELGERFEAIEIDSGPGNADGIPITAHSVLTLDLVDREGHPTKAALDRTLGFFRERLRGA